MNTDKSGLPSTIDEINKAYAIDGKISDYEVIHNGHINRTYEIEYTFADGKKEKRLLQQINVEVFKKPLELMDNVVRVTAFLRQKIAEANGDTTRETLTVYETADGRVCYQDTKGRYWRFYNFVDDAFTYNSIDNPHLFYEAGAAFGKFMSLLADFPIDTLYNTIPNFHDTDKRLEQLADAVKNNAAGRADKVKAEIDFAFDRKADTEIVTTLLRNKELPLRVTHNDTKLNNIMFDNSTSKPICVVDLDTVMPGSVLYDFGDSIRFGANTGAEDEKDLSKVSIDLELYENYVKGYLSTAGKSLTAKEVEYLPFSAKLMTFECGMRFLADYLNGDTYFGIDYPEHNLDRCRSQFKLVADMENKFDEMVRITNDAYSSIK